MNATTTNGRTTLLDAWASADTLAFMAFVPIRRALAERRFLDVECDVWNLTVACALATLAADLKDLKDAQQDAEEQGR